MMNTGKVTLEIVPSIYSCELDILTEELRKLVSAGAKKLHFDIMDG